jgi:hypothetical protein
MHIFPFVTKSWMTSKQFDRQEDYLSDSCEAAPMKVETEFTRKRAAEQVAFAY